MKPWEANIRKVVPYTPGEQPNARSSVIFVNMSSVSAAFLYYCVAFLYIKIPEYRQVDIYHSQSSCSSAPDDRSAAIQSVCAF